MYNEMKKKSKYSTEHIQHLVFVINGMGIAAKHVRAPLHSAFT